MPRRRSGRSRRRRRRSTSLRPDDSSTLKATWGPATWPVITLHLVVELTLLSTATYRVQCNKVRFSRRWCTFIHVDVLEISSLPVLHVCLCVAVLSMLPPLKEAIVSQLNSESLTALLKTKWVQLSFIDKTTTNVLKHTVLYVLYLLFYKYFLLLRRLADRPTSWKSGKI